MHPLGTNSFLYSLFQFSEGAWSAGKQAGHHQSCLPCKYWHKLYQAYPVPLISSTIWVNSEDDKLMVFSYFPRKYDFTFHANCILKGRFARID